MKFGGSETVQVEKDKVSFVMIQVVGVYLETVNTTRTTVTRSVPVDSYHKIRTITESDSLRCPISEITHPVLRLLGTRTAEDRNRKCCPW